MNWIVSQYILVTKTNDSNTKKIVCCDKKA